MVTHSKSAMANKTGNNHPGFLQIHLLGASYAILPDGERVRFKVDNTLLLIAYLGLNPSKIFHRSSLAALFYPDHDDRRASQNLRQVIHRLRKILKDDTRQSPYLLVDALTLHINPDALVTTDIAVFEQVSQTVQTHSHRRLGACRTCMAKLEETVSQVEGDFLDGHHPRMEGPLEEWIRSVRTEYKNRAVWILHLLTEYHFERQHFDRCEIYLRRLFEFEPLDEVALRLQMKILAFQGYRNQAIQRYHDFQLELQQILQLQPEEETKGLAQAIRSGDGDLSAKKSPLNNNLPIPQQDINSNLFVDGTIPFYGRKRELGQIIDLLESEDNRLIVLKGVIGSGKTRLAMQAAAMDIAAWRDGIYLVMLNRNIANKTNLLTALVHALGINSHNSMTHRKKLGRFLRDKEALILIDDLDEFSGPFDLIQSLIGLCPMIKFLITTRKHLGIRGEKVIEITGLEYPSLDSEESNIQGDDLEVCITRHSAMQLFRVIAQRAKLDFDIDPTNIADIIRTCDLLLGLPLGIELAASYSRLFSCQKIYEGVYGAINERGNINTFITQQHPQLKGRFESLWQSLNQAEREMVEKITLDPHGVATDDLFADVNGRNFETLVSLRDKSTLIQLPGSRVKLHPLLRIFMNP